MKIKLKNKLKKTIALSGAILAFAIAAPSFAQYGPAGPTARAMTARATTADPEKPDGALTTMVTRWQARDGGISTTSCGSTAIIRNGP